MVGRKVSKKQAKIQVDLNLRQPTGNFWIDNGLVTLYNMIGEGRYEVDEVLETIQERLLQKTGNIGQYFDEDAGELKEYERVNWAYPANVFISVSGNARKKKFNGKKYPVYPPRFKLNLRFSNTQKRCDLCGTFAPVTSAKMWMFPFIVEPQKFGNFYSNGKRGINLCPRCALAGVAGYQSWLWIAQGKTVLHLFLFHSDLDELSRLHREVLSDLQISGSKRGNIDLPFYGPYLHETTLALLLKLFSNVESSGSLSREGRDFLASLLGADDSALPSPITLYAITGKPGRAFNMQVFREFSQIHAFYRLYKAWMAEVGGDNPQQAVASVFRQLQRKEGSQYNTLWREKVAWAVLEFSDPFPYVEDFLFDARAKEKNPIPLYWGTMPVLNYYAKEVLSVDEALLRVLGRFGHNLGNEAGKKTEMGLLYALRNAKNLEEFLRVLNDVQFRLDLTVPEKFLEIGHGERIAGSPWIRVKTMLSIYAMNSYLRAKKNSKTEKGANAGE